MTTERDLIQRLANDLEGITEELVIPEYAHTEKERTDASLALVAEARAFLSQPEPEGPTDEELSTMLYYEFTTSTGHGERSDPIGFALAVRARWPLAAIKPVPVSERPWEREGWCDNNGWCWGFDADDTDPFWSFDKPEAWVCWTHVLPHYALPIPPATEKP